jgi:carbamoyl-phosphate synthase large subunit
MKIKVLVTGAGGDGAQGVIRALRKSRSSYEIASVCINNRSPGLHMSDIFEISPPIVLESEYVNFLIEFINCNKIDILIPTIDGEISLISSNRCKIEQKTNSKVIVGSIKSTKICSDKLETSEYLCKIGVDQPTILSIDRVDLIKDSITSGTRIIKKPRIGGGSKGISLLDMGDLEKDDWLNKDFIYQKFQKYSKEYTAVVMKDDDNIVAVTVLERILTNGRTTWCKRVLSDKYDKMLRKIAKGLDIPYLNIQFGIVNDTPYVFDLNPRFSGSTGVFSEVFNGPHLLTQRYCTGVLPSFDCSNKYFESVRYYEDLIYNCHEE